MVEAARGTDVVVHAANAPYPEWPRLVPRLAENALAAAEAAGYRGFVEVELLSNDAEPHSDGWRLIFRDEAACAICADRCKRSTLPVGRPLVTRR